MKIFYDILDDLEKIGSDSKETVVANDSDGFDFDIIITVCPCYTPADDVLHMKKIENVLNSFEPLIGEHSKVVYVNETPKDLQVATEFILIGYQFGISSFQLKFKKPRQLWRFFKALFNSITDNSSHNVLLHFNYDGKEIVHNDFTRYTDFHSHYPYGNKRLIEKGWLNVFMDFGIDSLDFKYWLNNLFEYNDYGAKRTEDKPSVV